jgi:hypothetical protein
MIVCDAITGAVKRVVVGDPAQFGAQAETGETGFAITTDPWGLIGGGAVVNEDGELVGASDYVLDLIP